MTTATMQSICCDANADQDYQNMQRCPACKENCGFYDDGPLVDENGRPLTTELFKPSFSDVAGLVLVCASMLILCGLSVIWGGAK